ncbi:PEP-CTERM sorting domain-containing protein [Aquincola sp. MAHUQ-54]|uniref:PEP-CTERM sorting domain-containing protein n=1 Tax=Aquincola agrisoli TaxID=3119538 RepID=A0AAW9QBG1_9BURK
MASLACATFGSHAAPVVFTGSLYETTATAIADATADVKSGSSDAAPLPLLTNALAFDGSNYAAGTAIATAGLLSTTAEASGLSGFASASGSGTYTGEFAGGGNFTFQFNYTSENFGSAGTYADSTLSFLLTNSTGTLVSTIVPVNDNYSFSLFIPSGTSNTFSLSLTSEATAFVGGDALNVASVGFQVTAVPEPTTWLLMLAGILLVAFKARPASRWRDTLAA